MSALKLLPIASISPRILYLPAHGHFLNSTVSDLPVVHYHPFESNSGTVEPSDVEALVTKHGFEPQWRYSMFDFDHFHSTTHELLVPFRGRATIVLGGMERLDVRAGDVLLLPAGVAHRAERAEDGFCMVGSYPAGAKSWDNCRGGEAGVEVRIKNLGKGGVMMDPMYGREQDAPVMNAWKL
jgi:uncharacterized protein YjlB